MNAEESFEKWANTQHFTPHGRLDAKAGYFAGRYAQIEADAKIVEQRRLAINPVDEILAAIRAQSIA